MNENIVIGVESIPGHNDRLIIKISGYLDAGNAHYTRLELEKICANGIAICFLDCSGLNFIDSTGSLCVFNFHIFLTKRGGELVIVGLEKNVATTFNALGIALLIKIFPSYAQAAAAFPQ